MPKSASAQPASHAAGYHGDDRWLLLWAALMLACLAAYHVSRAIRPQSIYHDALHRGTAIEEDAYPVPSEPRMP